MQIKLWGVRGSLPAPPTPAAVESRIRNAIKEFVDAGFQQSADIEDFVKQAPRHIMGGFGGNTLCVEVRTKAHDRQLIIDGGSGIRLLGYEMLKGPCGGGQGEAHVLLTHFHWDHVIGLPFFVPIFIPGNRIHFYAVQDELRSVLGTVFKKPFFPVPLEKLGAEIVYHRLEPRVPVEINGMKVTPYQLDHPDPCWGFKIESGGKVYSHCVDTECVRVSAAELGSDLPLYQNVDLMLFDSQYTLMESIEKVNWGHATATLAMDIAMREGIKKILFVHHDPASSDEKILAADTQAARYYQTRVKEMRRIRDPFSSVQWEFAWEGKLIEL